MHTQYLCIDCALCKVKSFCKCNRLSPSPYSLTENDSTITSLTSNWTDFYLSYQSFQSWLGNMDTEMSYINPFVGDLAAVREQLETQKVRTLRPNLCSYLSGKAHYYLPYYIHVAELVRVTTVAFLRFSKCSILKVSLWTFSPIVC